MDKKSLFTPYIVALYVIVFIMASAGAITHGFNNHEHVFTIAGALNLFFGGWSVWKIIKSHEEHK